MQYCGSFTEMIKINPNPIRSKKKKKVYRMKEWNMGIPKMIFLRSNYSSFWSMDELKNVSYLPLCEILNLNKSETIRRIKKKPMEVTCERSRIKN